MRQLMIHHKILSYSLHQSILVFIHILFKARFRQWMTHGVQYMWGKVCSKIEQASFIFPASSVITSSFVWDGNNLYSVPKQKPEPATRSYRFLITSVITWTTFCGSTFSMALTNNLAKYSSSLTVPPELNDFKSIGPWLDVLNIFITGHLLVSDHPSEQIDN